MSNSQLGVVFLLVPQLSNSQLIDFFFALLTISISIFFGELIYHLRYNWIVAKWLCSICRSNQFLFSSSISHKKSHSNHTNKQKNASRLIGIKWRNTLPNTHFSCECIQTLQVAIVLEYKWAIRQHVASHIFINFYRHIERTTLQSVCLQKVPQHIANTQKQQAIAVNDTISHNSHREL